MAGELGDSPPGWHPDPVGRHDYRYWSGDTWTEHVLDESEMASDPIGRDPGPAPEAVVIRPSWSAFLAQARATPAWRWLIVAVGLPLVLAPPAVLWGWRLVLGVAASLLAYLGVFLILYFKLFQLRASREGLVIRNSIGIRRSIPLDRIAAVTVGRAWAGGLSAPDQVFVVSPNGGRLARFYLQNWVLDDMREVAAALGFHLYGSPGRRLNDFYSGHSAERAARVLAGSALAGAAAGCLVPLVVVVVIVVFSVTAGRPG